MTLNNRAAYNAYQAVYQLSRYHARKKRAIEILGGKCNYCGSTADLEIDHIDKYQKSIKLSNSWSISETRFLAELEKCQLLCKPCHKGKSSLESSVGHGGGLTGVRNCRCDLCRPLKNAHSRARKRN